MTTIQSLDALKKAFAAGASHLKSVFGEVVTWLKSVKAETPLQLKTAAKVIYIILEERAKLAKRKALGLDAGKSTREYVAAWLGNKPNQRMMTLAAALPLVKEDTFDTAETWYLTTLGQIATRVGDYTLKQAVKDAVKAVEKKDGKAVVAIRDRVVEKEDGAWTYLTAAEAKAWHEKDARNGAVSVARVLTIDELLSVGVAGVLSAETLTAETATKAEAHIERLLNEIRAKSGKPTTADLAALKSIENHVAA